MGRSDMECKAYVTGSLRELVGYINESGIGRGDIVEVMYRGGEYIMLYYGELEGTEVA